jgi:3-hydroxybutyryl-CoA dehydratase
MTELCYEDIKVGDEASLTRTITETHIVTYAGLTGDMNPVHVDAEYAAKSVFGERIAHGMLTAGLISAVLGTQLRTTVTNQHDEMVLDGTAVIKKLSL